MENKETMGQVLPFARSTEYLRRLALKQRAGGKPVNALELLRASLQKKPGDASATLEMAETYAAMQCPEYSNRTLFSLLGDEAYAPECLYGLGCNFYAMRMAEPARDCLVLYLQRRPDGPYAPEAVDLIETIDSETEDGSEAEIKITARMDRALNSLDEGKPELAARQLRRVLSLEKHNGGAHALLSFALLYAGDASGALQAARHAMRCSREDIRALCAMAGALQENGSDSAARAFLARAVKRIENEEDSRLVCQTACEMGQHKTVQAVVASLEEDSPLSDELLHLMAAACHNAGQTDEAVRRWHLLRRVDPMDSVAGYYLRLFREGKLPREISYTRQVPLEETLLRLGRLRVMVQDGVDALRTHWNEDDELESLLRWGLSCGEPGIPNAMIGVLTTLEDEKAQAVLRDALCDVYTPDDVKHSALAALCIMGAKGPHYALIDGRLTLVHVSRMVPERTEPHIGALTRAVRRRLEPLTQEEEGWLEALSLAAVSFPGALGSQFRARGVELALQKLRGISHSVLAGPSGRRRLERFARRITKEAKLDGLREL